MVEDGDVLEGWHVQTGKPKKFWEDSAASSHVVSPEDKGIWGTAAFHSGFSPGLLSSLTGGGDALTGQLFFIRKREKKRMNFESILRRILTPHFCSYGPCVINHLTVDNRESPQRISSKQEFSFFFLCVVVVELTAFVSCSVSGATFWMQVLSLLSTCTAQLVNPHKQRQMAKCMSHRPRSWAHWHNIRKTWNHDNIIERCNDHINCNKPTGSVFKMFTTFSMIWLWAFRGVHSISLPN